MNRDEILIEADELLKRIDDPNLRLFDATITDDAYAQGHLPGAAYFDHERFSQPDSPYICTILPMEKLTEQVGASGISADSEVVVYACGMFPYAARAWWVLRYAGHSRVRILNGGFSAWTKAGGAVEQGSRSYAPAVFQGSPRPEMFADKDAVLAALQDGETSVEDVLPPESYAGAHITGSTCLSCMDLMHGLDALLPDEQLARRLNGASTHPRIITYCGGGIAATVNALAHLIAGQEDVAVYDGSLYEWIALGLPTTGTGKWEIWQMKR